MSVLFVFGNVLFIKVTLEGSVVSMCFQSKYYNRKFSMATNIAAKRYVEWRKVLFTQNKVEEQTTKKVSAENCIRS